MIMKMGIYSRLINVNLSHFLGWKMTVMGAERDEVCEKSTPRKSFVCGYIT